MLLIARQFKFDFPRPSLLMGILNVTPDSFSDGGQYFSLEKAVARGLSLAKDGADIIDVGGESTRPGSAPVPEEEELRRVIPVIEKLSALIKTPLSVDTMKPGVAAAALRAGAAIINDVAANREEEAMWRLAAETGAGYVCMHMKGRPQTMQEGPAYRDVLREVDEFFAERIERMSDCGMKREQLILDPGIGFGKTSGHNLCLLAGLGVFGRHERPVMIGVSRKSFLGTLPGTEPASRLPASLACACLAVAAGAKLVRAHDVAETAQALRITEAILAKQQS